MTSRQRKRGHVVVVGGGIAGLAAAFFLRDEVATVTVLEAAPRLGGKLASSEVAGLPVDSGAEALLARRPEAVDLIKAIGRADDLVYPGTTSARIWTRGEFRSLPKRQFMGVPGDFDELAASRILSPSGLGRAREDTALPATNREGDVPVGDYVGARFGAEVVDRLVDPLLGGVYAGRSDQLSYEATLPALARASSEHRSLADAVNALLGPAPSQPSSGQPSSGQPASGQPASGQPAPGQPPAPVFTTLAGGLGTLPEALAEASAAAIRTKATVRELARTARGWRLTVGPTIAEEHLSADAVILALPARPASRLVAQLDGGHAQAAAASLAEIEYASMAIVTLAYPASAFPVPLTGSGYLVPAIDGRPVKAATFSTIKWPHLGAYAPAQAPLHIVRCSVGRIGEETVLQRDDSDLIKLAAADLAAATGVTGTPADTRVSRWGGGLPQYTVGHLDRVAKIRSGVTALGGGLAVCGAAYDGIGVPACIASARLAADEVTAYLAGSGAAGEGTGE